MKNIIILFIGLFLTTGCSKLDFDIYDVYEKAEISNVTLYTIGESPENVVVGSHIYSDTGEIETFVKVGTDLTQLRLMVVASTGSSITPSIVGVMDMSTPKTYTVTSPNGTVVKTWTITVAIATGDEVFE